MTVMKWLVIALSLTVSLAASVATAQPKGPAPAYGDIDPRMAVAAEWAFEGKKAAPGELRNFLMHLPLDRVQALHKLLLPDDDTPGTTIEAVNGIERQIVWLSSNVMTYPFRDKSSIDYDYIASWVAAKWYRVDGDEETDILERAIVKHTFTAMWDELTPEQRRELLNKVDPSSVSLTADQKAGVALGSGTAAFAALQGTVLLSGFTFYTTMSTAIASAAGLLGATLPFGVYTAASTTVSVLTGPVGWAILGGTALVATWELGSANREKTATAIVAVHLLRAEAIEARRQRDAASVPPVTSRTATPWYVWAGAGGAAVALLWAVRARLK